MAGRATRARGWRWFARHRPLIVAVAVVGLIVALPRVREQVETASTGASPGAVVPGQEGDVPDRTPVVVEEGSDTGAGAIGPSERAGSNDEAVAGDADTAEIGAEHPGIGTEAALENPDCDPATGRIRFPSRFAPQCVAPWPPGADNGGSTATGVTGDSIKIVILDDPNPSASGPSREEIQQQVIDTVHAFADHYELWGRELDIRFYGMTGTDETSQRADAVRVSNEIKPFLASSFLRIGSETPRVWATELAARGVISFDEYVTYEESHAQAGFRWGYSPDDRYSALILGEYVGKRLAGRHAKWAGDEAFTDQTRSFGLAYDSAWDRGTFERTLDRYGGEITDAVSYDAGAGQEALQQQASTQVARLKSRGVNNVVLVGGVFYTAAITRAATQQGYFPEWTISGWSLQDTAVLSRVGPDQRQWAHAFGLGLVPPLESPITISERNQVHEWAHGRQPEVEAVNGQIYLLAKSIIAGIHLAGPNLTPVSFRDALFEMEPSGGRWCGCITRNDMSFGRDIEAYPGDKYFDVDDFTEKWWDADAVTEDEVGLTSKGAYQVVNGGRRYSPGDLPTTEPEVFDPSKSVISYSTPPAGDPPPDYPPPR